MTRGKSKSNPNNTIRSRVESMTVQNAQGHIKIMQQADKSETVDMDQYVNAINTVGSLQTYIAAGSQITAYNQMTDENIMQSGHGQPLLVAEYNCDDDEPEEDDEVNSQQND